MALLDDWDNYGSGSNASNLMHAVEFESEDALLEKLSRMQQLSKQESKMFTLHPIPYPFSSPIVHVALGNGRTVVALKDGRISCKHIDNPQDVEEINLSRRPGESIHKVHLDPTGTHLLVCLDSRETFYVSFAWPAPRYPKPLPKLKGVLIETIAWDATPTRFSSGDMLVGTTDNRVYHMLLDVKDGKVDVKMWRLVYTPQQTSDLADDKITGIYYERFPTDPSKLFVIMTSTNRIFRFVGRIAAHISDVFVHYTGEIQPKVIELPGSLPYSRLCISHSETGRANFLTWLSPSGLFSASIQLANQGVGDDIVGDQHDLLFFHEISPVEQPQGPKAPTIVPRDIFLTNFHWLILWNGVFQAINTLDKQVVSKDAIPGFPQRTGNILGFAYDKKQNMLWVYSESCLFEVVIDREDRNIWEIYLKKALENQSSLSHEQTVHYYEEANKYCTEQWQRDKVAMARGEFYFSSGQFGLAAKFFGRSNKSFEEIVLKFHRADQEDALKEYLSIKLEHTPEKNATQRTLLGTWLVQLFLDKLNALVDAGQIEQHIRLQEEFKQFMHDYHSCLDRDTVLTLISNQGRVPELLYFAGIVGDHERRIAHWLQQPPPPPRLGDAPLAAWEYAREPSNKAMIILESQAANLDLVYKFSPHLMELLPHKLVPLWIKSPNLEPRRLIPALMRYSLACNPPGDTNNHAIRYLRFCVEKLESTDPAIHNYLLSLYAKSVDQEPLLNFLRLPSRCYDLEYALRICMKEGKMRACVMIYNSMGLYEEAVDLALATDMDLAQLTADTPDDDELRKKLWIRIARHVLEVDHNTFKAVELLNHCELLKIEDILPYFPDFSRIYRFKELLVSSLSLYNRNIDDLLKTMSDATQSAKLLRDDIARARNRFGYITANQNCDLCNLLLISRPFYMFPCQHGFHTDCLEIQAMEHLDVVDRSQVIKIKNQLAAMAAAAEANHDDAATSSSSSKSHGDPELDEQLLEELDELLASDCVLCGQTMIDSIDRPFIDNTDTEEILSWRL